MPESLLLSAVLQQAARACYEELRDAQPSELKATLGRAKSRFLRLSILLSSCDEDGIACLHPGAAVEEVQRSLEVKIGYSISIHTWFTKLQPCFAW